MRKWAGKDPSLFEAYLLKLENDEDQLILHIKNSKTGARTEVRGKSGYEIDYDANDKLHTMLDKIGKSANISELMNGETVSINPKHPKGPESIAIAKDELDERGAITVPTSGGPIGISPHRPLKIAKSTPGKLRYNEAITTVDLAQLETFADKLFAKVGIDVEFTRHFLDRVNDERNKKPITMAELTRLFKQEFKRWAKPIAQMGPGQEAVMKDLQTDINLPFALQYDKDNNELDLIAKTVMRKKDFKTPDREFPVEDNSQDTLGSRINFPGFEKTKVNSKPKKDKPVYDKIKSTVKGWFDEDTALEEGINDPHIFKAVFLAGGPGSGKSFVAKSILGGTGLRSINSDEVYEFLMKKQDLSLDPETIFSPQGQEIRDKAKGLSRRREATYLDGRLGLIIDGTGKDVARYRGIEQKLKAIGYDTSMIYVNTSLAVAQQRNKQRERSLTPAAVEEMWNYVQQNLMQFQQMFGRGRFHIIDNSGGLEDLDRQKNFDKVYVETQRFLNTPPKHRKALAWIQQQKEQNDGTQRSAQQPQQPNKQSDGGTTDTN